MGDEEDGEQEARWAGEVRLPGTGAQTYVVETRRSAAPRIMWLAGLLVLVG